jgi:hypothetical protein
MFLLHQIGELVSLKSSRIRAVDSALVSLKCRAEKRLNGPIQRQLANWLFAPFLNLRF